MLNTRLLALSLMWAILNPVYAQTAPMDLLNAYRLAEQNNPQLLAAGQQQQAQLQRVPQARAQLLPQISVSGSANRVWEEMSVDQPPGGEQGEFPISALEGRSTYDTASARLDVTQTLYRREAFIALRQARVVEDEAELNFQLARQELLMQVAEAYFGQLEAADAVRSIEAELRAVQRELDRANRRHELGVGAITEVNDTRARYAATRASLLRARSQQRLAEETLQRAVNQRIGTLAQLSEQFEPVKPEPANVDEWTELAQNQSREVRAAELALDVAEATVEAARAQRYPKLDLVGSVRHDYQGANPTFGGIGMQTDSASIGLQLSMPLYMGGSISSEVRQRTAEREAGYHQLIDAKMGAALAAESAYITLNDTIEQIAALEEALAAAKLAEESTLRSLELGQRTTLDLLNVQRERYQVERDLSAARYQYLLAYLQLRVVVGGEISEAVKDVNALLAER